MTEDTRGIDAFEAILEEPGGWRTDLLHKIREVVRQAAPDALEEVKWRKPSKPLGVAVWVQGGNICIAEALKSAVRITFPNGAALRDPAGLFNARLTGNSVRAIDIHEHEALNAEALRNLVQEAVTALA